MGNCSSGEESKAMQQQHGVVLMPEHEQQQQVLLMPQHEQQHQQQQQQQQQGVMLPEHDQQQQQQRRVFVMPQHEECKNAPAEPVSSPPTCVHPVDLDPRRSSVDSTMSFDGAIGIDLGTTYSCVGVWQNERVEIIANDQGNRITPSYVAFNNRGRLIGDAAKNQAAINPSNTVFDVKRLIGRNVSDTSVQSDMKHWPFKVVSRADGKPLLEVQYLGETKAFTAEEVSAMVLVKMKETAESFLGRDVKKAVVSVPAQFNDSQRQATKDAGAIAGLEMLRLVNEPTAAAIAYGLDKTKDTGKNILIFDLGGGTFDVTLFVFDAGVFEAKAMAGDTHLGGVDFDNRLVDHFVEEFRSKHNIDPSQDKRALQRLRAACERAKRALSSSTQTSIEIDSLYDEKDFYTSVTRARFEELCADLFQSCLKPVEQVLRDAKMDKRSIHEVVLVGGSTRIPKVQAMVSEFFEGKEVNKSINPDEAVAFGAAVKAFMLGNGTSRQTDDILGLDVSPPIGIMDPQSRAVTPLLKNSTTPAKKSLRFTTMSDNQQVIDFQIVEGDHTMKECHVVGAWHLSGVPPVPCGVPQIEVTIEVETDGMIDVSAVVEVEGRKVDVTVTRKRLIEPLSQAEIGAMRKEAERLTTEQDKVEKERVEARTDLENYAYAMKYRATDERTAAMLSDADKKKIVDACEVAIEWFDTAVEASKGEYARQLVGLKGICSPILKLAGGAQGGKPEMSDELVE